MRAAAILFLACASASGFCQGAPKDVPKDDWAFGAVDQMYRMGLLVGYPDGNFNGDRPVSRFELAEGFSQLVQADEKLMSSFRNLQLKSDHSVDLGDLTERVRAMRDEVAALKSTGDELVALKDELATLRSSLADLAKSASEFRKQLHPGH